MPHEFRNLPSASHETLTIALVGAGGTAFVLLLIIGYVVWRDRRLKKPGQRTPAGSIRKARKKSVRDEWRGMQERNK